MRTQAKALLITTALAVLASQPAFAKNMSAQDFVTKASMTDKFEIASSKLATEKSKNDEVKAFAEMMIRDHSKTSAELKDTLKKSDSGAKPATALDEKHEAKLNKLAALSGREFDEQYVENQEEGHKKAVALFSDYSEHGEDGALKKFASDMLPALKMHLDHVKKLED